MKIKIDYWTKEKKGKPNFRIYHMTFNEEDIMDMLREKFEEKSPVDLLYDENREFHTIDIDEVIV